MIERNVKAGDRIAWEDGFLQPMQTVLSSDDEKAVLVYSNPTLIDVFSQEFIRKNYSLVTEDTMTWEKVHSDMLTR